MTMPSSEPYDSTTLSAGQQTNYNYQQPDLNFVAPLVSFPLIPEQAPLAEPLISDTVSNQRPSLPGGDFYTSQIFKDEAQLDNQGMMSNQHLMVKTLSQVEYNSEPSLIDTTALTHHNMSPVDTVSQYGMLINGQIGEDAAQNGWSLMDQHPNFDILLPNQRGGKRGPFKDHNLREQTAQTRKIGSCIRCRMQRIRVSDNYPRVSRQKNAMLLLQ